MAPGPLHSGKRCRTAPLEFAAPFLHLRVAFHAVQQHFADDDWMRPVALHQVNGSIAEMLSGRVAKTPGFYRFPDFSITAAAAAAADKESAFTPAVDAFAARWSLRPRHNLGSLQPVWGYDIAHYLAMVCNFPNTPSHAILEPQPRTWLVAYSLRHGRDYFGCIVVDNAPIPEGDLLCSELTCLIALLRRPCDNPERYDPGAAATGAVVVTIDKTLRARVVTAVLEYGAPPSAEGVAAVSMRVSVGRIADFSAANSKETWGNDTVVRWKSDLAGLLCQMTSPPAFPALPRGPSPTSSLSDASPGRRLVGARRRERLRYASDSNTVVSVISSMFSRDEGCDSGEDEEEAEVAAERNAVGWCD
ncbi:hypothetical protein MFIFM68171_09683 [Madurella fahalii]|uniref:Uncharacterized protein n=1 Tax=Madurella fahalii TaxID=1157608 RepID=A0ABQ0GP11_9PEZI